jgi:hypothetical protein
MLSLLLRLLLDIVVHYRRLGICYRTTLSVYIILSLSSTHRLPKEGRWELFVSISFRDQHGIIFLEQRAS